MDEILFDGLPLFRIYKSGRIERFAGAKLTPAGIDPRDGVTSKDVVIDSTTNIWVRLYLPILANYNKKLPILIYYHGGGFCVGSAASSKTHAFLNSLVSRANILAVSVSYRLAPEHLLPACYDDSWAAIKWVLAPQSEEWLTEHGDLENVFLGGDSVGANIAHRMAMQAGHEGRRLAGMQLIHPFFWGTERIGSEKAMIGESKYYEELWKLVNRPGVEVDDPRLNPIADGAPSLAGLGCWRVMVCVAEDHMVERGRSYYEALKRSGWRGEAELFETRGEGHAFHLTMPGCDKALELMEKLVGFFYRGSHNFSFERSTINTLKHKTKL